MRLRPRQSGVRALDALDHVFGALSAGLNALGTLWIFALMLLINADVLGRNFFLRPIAGVAEIVSLSIVGIVFLQLSNTLRSDRLTRSDMLLNLLQRRAPRLVLFIEVLFNLAGAFTLWVLVQASWPRFMTALARGETVGITGHFVAPTWPIKLILVVGAIALLVQFLFHAVYAVVGIIKGPPPNENIATTVSPQLERGHQ